MMDSAFSSCGHVCRVLYLFVISLRYLVGWGNTYDYRSAYSPLYVLYTYSRYCSVCGRQMGVDAFNVLADGEDRIRVVYSVRSTE